MKKCSAMLLALALLVGCGGPPLPTPNLAATQVAMESAAHATLTAEAPTFTPMPLPTDTPEPAPTPTATATPASTPSPTPTTAPTPTQAPSITPTPIHPVARLTYHKADRAIAYDWYTYVPRSLKKTERGYILILPLSVYPPTDDYDFVSLCAQGLAREYQRRAEAGKYILLVPAIPRPETNHVYVVAFSWKVFLSTSDPLVQRPDLKVNSMIDKLTTDLRSDGYKVQEKVFVQGFSAGGMFAQRYALLHPGRVKAIAVGQSGGSIVLPETSYNGVEMNWPLGVNDFRSLVGYGFDRAAYKQVPQFIYIGDLDTGNSTLGGTGDLWRAQEQIDFVNSAFGGTDPVRLGNECRYLIKLGYNIRFREYHGVAHVFTGAMQDDVFAFLNHHK